MFAALPFKISMVSHGGPGLYNKSIFWQIYIYIYINYIKYTTVLSSEYNRNDPPNFRDDELQTRLSLLSGRIQPYGWLRCRTDARRMSPRRRSTVSEKVELSIRRHRHRGRPPGDRRKVAPTRSRRSSCSLQKTKRSGKTRRLQFRTCC